MTSTLAIEQIAFAREIQRRAKSEIEVQSHTLRTASEQIARLPEQLTQKEHRT